MSAQMRLFCALARMPARLALPWALFQNACSGPLGAAPERAAAHRVLPLARTDDGVADAFQFRAVASSPEPLGPQPPVLEPFFALCARGDAALVRVAERVARRKSEGKPPLDVAELSFALRAEGAPYVWPRAWTLEGGEVTGADAIARMRSWLTSFNDGGERRCGVALAAQADRTVMAAVAVDALGDLEPLGVQTSTGAWLDVEASLLVGASDAKIVVLGPNGAPRAVPTSFNGSTVRAKVRVDRSGAFLLQVLANVSGGPRPILEATVFSDVPPPSAFQAQRVPGEDAPAPGGAEPGEVLLAMLNGARESEGRPPLARDRVLDSVAARHAEAMRAQRRIAHDAGEGDPRSRLEGAGISVVAAGENIAHAADLRRAHRALWASPSHRETLLQPRFDKVGIGVASDPDGSVWVCAIFVDQG
jgi:uncharacterized protein YkwD